MDKNSQSIEVTVNQASSESSFLDFLAEDICNNPHKLQAVSQDWVRSMQSLVAEIEVDLNAFLLDEDE
jgi:hypothetical protein